MGDVEVFKAYDDLLLPDVRGQCFLDNGKKRTLQSLHDKMVKYELDDTVPDAIMSQFNVARNIFVYGWLDYNFFNVADSQVLTVLELAIREKVNQDDFDKYRKSKKMARGLKSLMSYCYDNRLVKNEGFSAWYRNPYNLDYQLYENEAKRKIQDGEATSVPYTYIKPEHLDPIQDYDHCMHLVNTTNHLRNEYAHGSKMLNPFSVESTFEMVHEFINQIYSIR